MVQGVTNPFDSIEQAVFQRMRENRHKKETQERQQEAFEERQDMINNSVSDFNSGSKSETSSFEDQASSPSDILEDTHKDTDFNQEDAIEEAKETVSNGEKSRNELIQDNMNEKLADKGIKVRSVNSELADKHGLDSTKQPNPEAMEAKKEALKEQNAGRDREDVINNPRPAGHITQATGSQKSQSQSHDSRDDKDRPADLL